MVQLSRMRSLEREVAEAVNRGLVIGAAGPENIVAQRRGVGTVGIPLAFETDPTEFVVCSPGFSLERSVEIGGVIELETCFSGENLQLATTGRIPQTRRRQEPAALPAPEQIIVAMLIDQCGNDVAQPAGLVQVIRSSGYCFTMAQLGHGCVSGGDFIRANLQVVMFYAARAFP